MALELETYNARMHAWEPVVEKFRFALQAAHRAAGAALLRPPGLRLRLQAEEEVRLTVTRDLLRAITLAGDLAAGLDDNEAAKEETAVRGRLSGSGEQCACGLWPAGRLAVT